MRGGRWRAVAGGSAVGLLATAVGALANLTTGPAQAEPTTCVVADNTVAAVSLLTPHGGQPSQGNWTDVKDDVTKRPWYGLYYPFTDPDKAHATPRVETFGGSPAAVTGDAFQWRLTGACQDTGVGFTAKGEGVGYCGRSVGAGKGRTTAGRSFDIRWESAGTQLVLTHPSASGTLNAQANLADSSSNSCANGTATQFVITGAIVGLL